MDFGGNLAGYVCSMMRRRESSSNHRAGAPAAADTQQLACIPWNTLVTPARIPVMDMIGSQRAGRARTWSNEATSAGGRTQAIARLSDSSAPISCEMSCGGAGSQLALAPCGRGGGTGRNQPSERDPYSASMMAVVTRSGR